METAYFVPRLLSGPHATRRHSPFVLSDFIGHGIAFEETEPGFSHGACCRRIALQDHSGQPLAVFRASEGHFDDVSQDIARGALKLLLDGVWLFENGFDDPEDLSLPEFISFHCPDARAAVRDSVGAGGAP